VNLLHQQAHDQFLNLFPDEDRSWVALVFIMRVRGGEPDEPDAIFTPDALRGSLPTAYLALYGPAIGCAHLWERG
jgi:hypothetical protein